MTPLAIDFAPRSLRQMLARLRPWTRLAVVLGTALGLMLVISAAFSGYRLLQSRPQQAPLHQLRPANLLAPTPTIVLSAPQAAAINRTIRQLNLPWREVQQAIALATPKSVALLSLEPDAGKQAIRILAEAASSQAMFDYLHDLQQQAVFETVNLTRHEINEQDANNPIRFQIDAQWAIH